MINIFVKGQQLVMNRNTTMTVELNNALFASPDIEGDVSFSFTLPVEGNERVLEFAHLPQADKVKKFPCTVHCNGGFNWNGELLVQKSSHDTITAALIINPYPDGFGKRSITKNHDKEIVIANSRETHDLEWEQFLAASVNNPDVKFAPFFNEEGYGNENENYGYWNGYGRKRIVNSLFFTTSGELIDTSGSPFSKAHNQRFGVKKTEGSGDETINTSYVEINQLAFCPQISITKIIEIWCRNAGYKFINHMGEDFASTFLQSQKSLDALASQYGTDTKLTIRTTATEFVSAGYHWCSSYWINGQSQDAYVHNGQVWIPYNGWWEMTIDCDFSTELKKYLNYGGYNPFNVMGPTVVLTIYKGTANFTDIINGSADILYQESFNSNEPIHIHEKQYIPPEFVYEGLKFILLCECRQYAYEGTGGGYYESTPSLMNVLIQEVESLQMEVMFHAVSADQQQLGFNIFRSHFNIPELLPDVSNSSFMKTILEATGMCYYISGKTKRIELIPYAILKKAKSLDLTAYELTREGTTEKPDETMRTFRLKPMKDEEYNEKLRISDVEQNMPDAYENHEHYVLRTTTNTLYKAVKKGDDSTNWTEGWEEYCGNPDKLEIGEGDEENREPSVLIPHQRLFSTGRKNPDTDTYTGEIPQLMVADFTIVSDLYNTTEKPNEIILTQYRGFRQREYQTGTKYHSVKNEVMLPVWGNEFALKAKGPNSLGERYVKPVLELLCHKKVTKKFRLPANMMQAVEDLLRPSDWEPSKQTRFITVRNVRMVPKRITFQIDNDIDDTVLCQIEAVKVY